MKLQRVNRNSRPAARLKQGARLNKIVFVVALLWLVISALVLFFSRPGEARAVEPAGSRQQLALHVPQG